MPLLATRGPDLYVSGKVGDTGDKKRQRLYQKKLVGAGQTWEYCGIAEAKWTIRFDVVYRPNQ